MKTDYKPGDRVRISGWAELTEAEIEDGEFDLNGKTGVVLGRGPARTLRYIVVELDDKSNEWWTQNRAYCLPEELELIDE